MPSPECFSCQALRSIIDIALNQHSNKATLERLRREATMQTQEATRVFDPLPETGGPSHTDPLTSTIGDERLAFETQVERVEELYRFITTELIKYQLGPNLTLGFQPGRGERRSPLLLLTILLMVPQNNSPYKAIPVRIVLTLV
ncbi:25S rRNA (adenine645-N1)-methyltransferase [Hypoxylon texense]